ncbi:MAG TPA: aminopeptidase P family protein [Myxococcaceae bacterium]|nr:aminopeptidase P family protein [Myxococcaceae bacterium]
MYSARVFAPTFDRVAHARRRESLAEAMQGQPFVLASGKPRPRNYAASVYPFRAASHFLYVFGISHPDALGHFDGNGWTLYLPNWGPEDALWEGAVPSSAEVEERAGVPVHRRAQLPPLSSDVAALPTPDLETCLELEQLLGRPIRPGLLEGADALLADALIALRLRHDEHALRELRLAAETTAAVHRAGMGATRPGLRESEIAAVMEAEALRRDVALAYLPIVTIHGEVLHNHHHQHLLGERDLLLADVGAESPGGYAGDVTRTWPVSGRFSSTQRALYDVVLGAQRAAIDRVKPGVRYRDLHLHAALEMTRGLVALGILRGDAEELVQDGVSALLFPHGVGHLLGLDVHDMEDLGDRAGYAEGRTRSGQFGLKYLRLDRDLEPGMAVTIEPGLYVVPAILQDPELSKIAGDRLDRRQLAHFSDVRGIRIEDDVVVTGSGAEVLTAAIPKEPSVVEEAVGR